MAVFTKDRSFYRSLVTLAVPISLQNLVTFAVSFADNVMIGSLGTTPSLGCTLAGSSSRCCRCSWAASRAPSSFWPPSTGAKKTPRASARWCPSASSSPWRWGCSPAWWRCCSPVGHPRLYHRARRHPGGRGLCADCGLYLSVLFRVPGDDSRHAQRGDRPHWAVHLLHGAGYQCVLKLRVHLWAFWVPGYGGAGRGPGHVWFPGFWRCVWA